MIGCQSVTPCARAADASGELAVSTRTKRTVSARILGSATKPASAKAMCWGMTGPAGSALHHPSTAAAFGRMPPTIRSMSRKVRSTSARFPVQDGVGVYLFDDVAHVHGRRRRAPLDDRLAVGAKIVGGDLVQQAGAPLRQDFPVEDGPPHVAGAVRHRSMIHPSDRHLLEPLGLLQPALDPLLVQRRRNAFGDLALRLDQLLPRPGEREPGRAVGAERDRLAPPVEAVVVLESDAACRCYEDVQTVPVGLFVRLRFSTCISQFSVGEHAVFTPKDRQAFSGPFGIFFLSQIRSLAQKKDRQDALGPMTVWSGVSASNGGGTVGATDKNESSPSKGIERLRKHLSCKSVI